MSTVFAIVKRLFASNKVSFIITAIVVFCAATSDDSKIALSNGNYTWLLAVMSPFFFVFYDYTKLMYLGTSKKDYFFGSLTSYVLLALLISLINTGIHFVIDPLNQSQTVINIMDICGWTANGVILAFIQQALFLLLTMIFLHVLLSMQPYRYGWLTDGIFISIICIFTPITPMRKILAQFFNAIMFNNNALWHIGICLFLSGISALTGLIVLKRKTL